MCFLYLLWHFCLMNLILSCNIFKDSSPQANLLPLLLLEGFNYKLEQFYFYHTSLWLFFWPYKSESSVTKYIASFCIFLFRRTFRGPTVLAPSPNVFYYCHWYWTSCFFYAYQIGNIKLLVSFCLFTQAIQYFIASIVSTTNFFILLSTGWFVGCFVYNKHRVKFVCSFSKDTSENSIITHAHRTQLHFGQLC
jgi:hypothetical protein